MKRLLFTLAVLMMASQIASAQCVPDPAITQPGIYPDTVTNLPTGTAGVFYSSDIQVKVITDTTVSGINVDVVNITIDSVGGLPAGFGYACTPSNCVFPGGSNGCIRLSGTNATPGTYPLTVYVTLNGLVFGSFPATQAATITGYRIVLDAPPPVPAAAFSASATTVCKGESVTFTDQSTNSPDTWSWSFPGGTPSTSTQQNPVVQYLVPGTYSVTLTVSNPNGSDVLTQTNYITVNGKPDAQITPQGVVKFCPGESATLTASQGAGYTYQWYEYGVLLNGETNSTLAVTNGGEYKVKVTDPSTGCTKVSPYRLVRQHPKPNISINASGPVSFCSGGSVNLVATTGITNSIQWTKGGVNVNGATANSYQAGSSGFYKAIATSQNGCTRISNGISVKAWPLPNGGITQSGPLSICQGDSVTLSVINYDPLNSYQWEAGLQPISGATGQNYVATAAGSYTFLAESPQGCQKRSPVRVVSITCREMLTQLHGASQMSVYPNPSEGMVNLELTIGSDEHVNIAVYDLSGRVRQEILQSGMTAGRYSLSADLSHLEPGVYLIRMNTEGGTQTKRLVIQ